MSSGGCPITEVDKYNFSAFDYPGMKPEMQLTWKGSIQIVIYLFLLVSAIIGNVLVILVVYYNQSMRSTINYYLVNLAVADFLIACCCIWVHVVNELTQPLFVLGAFMCKFNSFAQMTTQASSVLTLAVISCDRFVAVIFPLRVRLIQQRHCLIIVLIWILAMAVSTPFLIYKEYSIIKWRNFVETTCMENWPAKFTHSPHTGKCGVTFPSKQVYYTFVSVSLFFLPIVVMMATYCMIVWRLWITEMPGERSDAAVYTQSRAKRKVVKMVFIVLLVFIICWMPLQVIILYAEFTHSRQQHGELPPWTGYLSSVAYFIAYANSAINPIIYGGFNASYRQGIKAILRCQPRSQFPVRTRLRHGGTMTTTLSSSCRQKDNRSSFTHDNSHILEMKYVENDHDIK